MTATGAAIQGAFESSSNGNRIIIDPTDSSIKVINSENEVVGVWYFYDRGSVLVIEDGNHQYSSSLSSEGFWANNQLTGDYARLSPTNLNVGDNGVRSLEVVDTNERLLFRAYGLPTNTQSLGKGEIWVDSNGYLRIVT
jgi:hypothetical protein